MRSIYCLGLAIASGLVLVLPFEAKAATISVDPSGPFGYVWMETSGATGEVGYPVISIEALSGWDLSNVVIFGTTGSTNQQIDIGDISHGTTTDYHFDNGAGPFAADFQGPGTYYVTGEATAADLPAVLLKVDPPFTSGIFTLTDDVPSNPIDDPNPLTAVPEPATLALLGVGIAGMLGYSWRSRKLALA